MRNIIKINSWVAFVTEITELGEVYEAPVSNNHSGSD